MLGECKDDTSHKGIYGLLREFWLRPDVRTPSQAKEIRLRFAMKAAAQFAIYEKDDFVKDYDKDGAEFERKFEDLLRLASSYVLSEPANVQQADIERHHIMFHFCNKLAVLFSYATIASLVGIGWYFILKHYSLKTTGWGWFMLYEGKNA